MARSSTGGRKRLATTVVRMLTALGVLVSTVVVVIVASATPSLALTTGRLPLLLVHGYSDDCHDAFNFTSVGFKASYDTETLTYLLGHGYAPGGVKTVGYYNGTWTAKRDSGPGDPNASDDLTCDVNI